MFCHCVLFIHSYNYSCRITGGGGPLGCVLLGSGSVFQILAYNGAKETQLAVSLTPQFTYTLADLYMSFADTLGNKWSVCFDTQGINVGT